MAIVLINASLARSLTNFRGPLISELLRRGHKVHASAPAIDGDTRSWLTQKGVVCHEVPLERTGVGIGADIRYAIALLRLVRAIRPDAVLNYTIKPNIWGSLAARLCRVPCVSMVTGIGYAFYAQDGLKHRAVSMIARLLYRISLSGNRVVLFQNPDDIADVKAAGALGDRTPVRLINGSGIDLTHYVPAPLPPTAHFLMIARLLKSKGVVEYARASMSLLAKMPDVTCTLVGMIDDQPDGIDRSQLAEWEAGGLNYLGELSDVRPAIAAASVYVLPSYREGTPRSTLEAMAMGRAVITTDAPGCRETVVNGDNGLLVPVGDADALAAAMATLATAPDLRAAMGASSLDRAQTRFAVDKVNDAIIDALGLPSAGSANTNHRNC